MVVLVDDSWSVGPIDFSRQIDFSRMLFSALNPAKQKSALVLYSHRQRVIKKFEDSIGAVFQKLRFS